MDIESEYSQGICDDGAAILCNGQPLTIEEILHGLCERDEALAKLTAMESQNVFATIVKYSFVNEPQIISWNEMDTGTYRLYAKPVPADKPLRITEKDVREIEKLLKALALVEDMFERNGLDKKMKNTFEVVEDAVLVGRALLKKLNADREQVPEVAAPDDSYELMTDLAAALYACVNAGKINESDIIKQDGNRAEIGHILDRAEDAMIRRNSFASDPSHSHESELSASPSLENHIPDAGKMAGDL